MESNEEDPGADTAMFQAFQDADEPAAQHNHTFRIVSLVVGLVIFVGIVALLLQ